MISIVIPVYQAKKYLDKCIKSILDQVYYQIELLLIDDGSTDGSAEICDKYAAKDGRVQVIHQKNSGVSAARNVGIDNATGEYLMFVDADDFILPKFCENAIQFASEADLIISGYMEDWGDSVKNTAIKCEEQYARNEFKKNFDRLYKLPLLNSPFAKLYKKDLLADIRFSSMSLGEDFVFNLKYYSKCDKILLLPNTDYVYNQTNTNSATKNYKDEYFPNQKLCYEEGKRFKYGELKFTNDALDETFCANGINLIQLICYQTKDRKLKKHRIRQIIDNNLFQSVCKGKYEFSKKLKIPQTLCRYRSCSGLCCFYALKKIISKPMKK